LLLRFSDALAKVLFNGYMEREQNIGDIDFLVSSAESVGLSGSRELLKSEELYDEVSTSCLQLIFFGGREGGGGFAPENV
jgi:predicted DsbA family dithiol-disulfide isomerase